MKITKIETINTIKNGHLSNNPRQKNRRPKKKKVSKILNEDFLFSDEETTEKNSESSFGDIFIKSYEEYPVNNPDNYPKPPTLTIKK